MKRVVTQQDTLKAAIDEGQLTCKPPGNSTTTRKRRNSQTLEICDPYYYRLIHIPQNISERIGIMV
jgi:hypothetical protein